MKTPRWFTGNRFVSHLRRAGAVALMSAATAMAFVAVNPSGPLWVKSDNKDAFNKLREARAEFLRNKLALPGAEREGGPMAAAEEDYANRAGPAAYVPFELTRSAKNAWTNVMAMAMLAPVNQRGAQWQLIGPSKADFPDVLTFSGAPYRTSGRVTALVIDPNCNTRQLSRLGSSSRRRRLAQRQGSEC